ncbi:MAG: DNA-deoxyinosine glycosylase [Alphaproteobacteria bacterium]|nr:DNA-deoxyinosine glycosylase [Alphaproteobacteria bacterium]MBV9585823.1 DNA-deoxyinosine glycosylase [Alphaproteobacteria bacterium]MBV9965349.1 DNA-deoxyinosine glycosylase [Alphaproteobacteria bacterium]
MTTASVKRSFPPIIDARARLLVLGTLPGEESLRRGEYYAHPRNLFWPIVFALFGETPPPLYADRVGLMQERRLAVWDVCASAQRVASADTSIAGEMPNAIDALLDTHPGIGAVAFNGSGAQRLYDRHFPRRPELRYFALPSTSPAHARLRFHDKLARWNVLREVLIG